jgi:formylglycine-generating enzyme required for sulfatase activity
MRLFGQKSPQFAERDVQELAAVLREQGFVVRTLIGRVATRDNIEAALSAVSQGRTAKDVVVIGFAGLGVQMPLEDAQGNPVHDDRGTEVNDAYFCPVDADVGKSSTMISLTRLVERRDRESAITLLLVDACLPGPPFHRGTTRSLSGEELVGRLPVNAAILFSCSKGQQPREFDGAWDGHSVFFQHILDALRGAAADPETGEVAWDDLVGYVCRRVNPTARALDAIGMRLAEEDPARQVQSPYLLDNLVATPVLARRRTTPEIILTKVAGVKLKLIPAGAFHMGSNDDDTDADRDERPQHIVRITRPFYLGIHEVTQAQYETVMGTNPSWFSPVGGGKDLIAGQSTGRHPVEEVSWLDAVMFCNKLSDQEGLKPFYEIDGTSVRVRSWDGPGYRLPTEAEWEFACRAGAMTRYSFGDDPHDLGEVAWFRRNSGDQTHSAGQKQPNQLGLFDMHGNVWEWCWDGYGEHDYKLREVDDPAGPPGTTTRVIRGGGWDYLPRDLRSASRNHLPPDHRAFVLGFRIARLLSPD